MKKYEIKPTNKFIKDLQTIKNRKYFDEDALNNVVDMLANDKILPKKYCNHLLEPKRLRVMGMSYKTGLVIDI